MNLLEQVSLHAFIQNNSIVTESGEPLNFHSHRFLFDIYADRSSLMCCMKCAQIGFTTYEIIKSAHEAFNEGMDIIYVLPTADDVKKFSGGKTNRIIERNPIFQEWTKDKDSVEQKRFGGSTIYYLGSWTERAALMITAKKLIVDEFDRCKQSIVEQYDSRLQSVSNPRKAYFSNPSNPDFGIDVYWKLSDMKSWHVTHSCGHRFIMDESCIDYAQEKYICPSCKGEILDEERRMGDWYNKDGVKWSGTIAGSYEWSGWWIPLWIAPWMSASKIAEYKRTKTPEYFANFVAGTPYIGSDNVVSRQTIEKNIVNKVNDQTGRIIIGLDTGLDLHYVLGNKEGIFHHGRIEPITARSPIGYDPYLEIERYLVKWPNAILIADQGGDLTPIRRLQAKYPGRVFLCLFRKDSKNKELIKWGEKEEFGKVTVDRNRALQFVIEELKDSRLPFYGTVDDWKPYTQHWLNIYRAKEQVDPSEPTYGWDWVWKRKGADHWVMATLYWRVGMEKYAEALATIIGAKDTMMSDIPTGRIFRAE